MPSPRAIVQMRVQAERRLATDVQLLADNMGMAEETVPQLLVPRVPHNDPNFRHVMFLRGVSTLLERFLEHLGVDYLAAQQEAEMPGAEVNTANGANLAPAVGDPRMVTAGQGLLEPLPPHGVVPTMLEGEPDEIADAISNTTAADVAQLKSMEQQRVGGHRAAVMDVLNEREAFLAEEAENNASLNQEHEALIEQRRLEAQANADAQAAADAGTPPDPAAAEAAARSMATPERPAAAVRQRGGSRVGRGR